jgi:hypothetical protein
MQLDIVQWIQVQEVIGKSFQFQPLYKPPLAPDTISFDLGAEREHTGLFDLEFLSQGNVLGKSIARGFSRTHITKHGLAA